MHQGILQAFKHMKNGGLVVNISSTAGVTCIGDMMATPTYVASKHAVTALTRTFGVSTSFKKKVFTNELKLHVILYVDGFVLQST